jgi:hypothetical protein
VGGLTTTWPCVEQRRIRRDWTHSESAEPRKAQYDPKHRQRRDYNAAIVRRAIDRQRKELLSAIARKLADNGGGVQAATLTEAAVEAEALEHKFLEQASIWDRETAHLSSTPKMILHDSYQKIMAMGPDVVPHLLRDLERNRRSWFWALRHLTGTNPVPPQDQGDLDKMIEAWVSWGKREGRF